MLETPFGKIEILVDGIATHYEAKPFEYIKPPVKDKPIAGCYRIHIPVENHHSIQCILNLENENVDVSGSSGERYLCREFCAGTTMLAIGIEDENPAFESKRVENGMIYRMNDKIDEVVFGIAWAIDYAGTDDVRVWFAADPTVYFKKEMYSVYLDRSEKNNSKWLEMITEAIKGAKTFEIHCWNEENEWINVALQYGTLKYSDWKYGKIIVGTVTPEFSNMLLNMPKPQDIEIYNKMTPFFNVFLDGSFQSCHYGTEIYVEEK